MVDLKQFKGFTKRRLQIGMWNGLNEDFWNQYSSNQINGIEICQYKDKEELDKLLQFCSRQNIKFGIHTPVYGGEKTLPEITSLELSTYEDAMKHVENEVSIAAEIGANYLLLHYPFPPIYPVITDRRYWGGAPNHAYYYSENYSEQAFLDVSDRLFQDLIALQERYNQKIILEYDFFGEYEDVFVSMFKKYPEIQLVIDTQRIEHHKRTFPGFDPYQWIDNIAPYVYLVHYSNVRFGENHQRHIPVLPHHEFDEQYGDSYLYLKHLVEKNDTFHVTFEHNPSLVTREELLQCYRLVEDLMKPKSDK